MRIGIACHHAVAVAVAATLLSGCVASNSIATEPALVVHANSGTSGSKTFYYTGREQSFKVPTGVHKISVVARGAAGGGNVKGGNGGRVHATIPVVPGETLYVDVGGAGLQPRGGFNGGAPGGQLTNYYCNECEGYGGGGASDVREGSNKVSARVLIAGGGGGHGGGADYYGGTGGSGGGKIGGNGENGPGTSSCGGRGGAGGTQSRGGRGGLGGVCMSSSCNGGISGQLHSGGRGGAGSSSGPGLGGAGGGGGGGYYGGGGGGAGCVSSGGGTGGGAGGGSSYVERDATNAQMWQGWKNAFGNGLVVFSWQ